MKVSRRRVLAGIGAAPVASSALLGLSACQSGPAAVSAPYVSRGGTYSLKPVNDGFAAVLETKDFGVLANDPTIAAELQTKLDKHLILHVRPEVMLTRPAVGAMAYNLGYPRDGRRMPLNPPAPAAVSAPAQAKPGADGYGGQPSTQSGPAPRRSSEYGEFAFIADFGGPAEPTPTVARKPRYIETLHTDGGAYSVNATIDVPPASPHTFADMQAAYRTLPRHLKQVVERSHALHAGLATTSTPYDELPGFDARTALRRPMLLAHYRTKTPQLYLPKNPQSLIEGMPEDEGRAVIAELWAHVNTQRNRYMAWSGPNEAMIWDAHGTTHTNPSYRREKARVTWFFVIPSHLPLTQATVA
jgi:hypothetical protein